MFVLSLIPLLFVGTIDCTDGELEKPIIEPEVDKSSTNETGVNPLDLTNESEEPYLVEYTPIAARISKTVNLHVIALE